MIAKAPAALAESTAKAEHLVENLQPLADVSFESRAAAETAFAQPRLQQQQKEQPARRRLPGIYPWTFSRLIASSRRKSKSSW